MASIRAGKESAKKIFSRALKAVSPEACVKRHLKALSDGSLKVCRTRYDLKRYKNIFVIGGGKASCPMAKAVEELLGERLAAGCVVTKYGHALKLKKIRALEAAHPVPDGGGIKGARAVLKIAGRAGPEDLVICLVSGGASALLASPDEGISLKDKQKLTRLLINSGATIQEINAVRKHLSRIKGGGLARVIAPAEALSLIISDVVGDYPSTIASGPTSPDMTTYRDCLAILKRYGLTEKAPWAVFTRLRRGAKGLIEETPKPRNPIFRKIKNFIIADNRSALFAAKDKARALGFRPVILSSVLKGETHEASRFLTAVIKEVKTSGNPVRPPACILLGGETSFEVKGGGLGGRNQEFALTAALEIEGMEGVTILSAGTDGTDGATDAAGAFVDSKTVKRGEKRGMDALEYLKRNDSYSYFNSLGDLFITGPTRTNVMDMVVALVE
jgi:hydroxypyruvate reductase